MNNIAQDVIQAYERSLVKIILYCIAELPFQFGMKRIVQVLRGSKSSFVIDHEIYKLDMYGILPNFRSAYLDRVIEKMREQG
jgi:superfamily II DNA helicase RecQ